MRPGKSWERVRHAAKDGKGRKLAPYSVKRWLTRKRTGRIDVLVTLQEEVTRTVGPALQLPTVTGAGPCTVLSVPLENFPTRLVRGVRHGPGRLCKR